MLERAARADVSLSCNSMKTQPHTAQRCYRNRITRLTRAANDFINIYTRRRRWWSIYHYYYTLLRARVPYIRLSGSIVEKKKHQKFNRKTLMRLTHERIIVRSARFTLGKGDALKHLSRLSVSEGAVARSRMSSLRTIIIIPRGRGVLQWRWCDSRKCKRLETRVIAISGDARVVLCPSKVF